VEAPAVRVLAASLCAVALASVLAACKTGGSSSASASLAGDSWSPSAFTDPRKFKPGKIGTTNPPFVFLVVAVLDPKVRDTQHDLTTMEAEQKKKAIDTDKAIDLMETPERISDKAVISGSLIDQNHLQTWAMSGFVLAVPPENIVAASPDNLEIEEAMIPGATKAKIEQVLAQARKKGKPSPADLLDASNPKQYNEVGFVGKTKSGSKVKIIGAFIKTELSTGKDLCNDAQAARIKDLAKAHDWPIVRILQPRPVTKKKTGKDGTEFDF
jgi:hypothetical protein